jgi:hypothetical protein
MKADVMNEVVILSRDEAALMELAVAFRGTPYEITAVEPARAMPAATRLARRRPAAMVVSLDGKENLAEIRALLSASPLTRFLFLVPGMPPSAALSRVVNASGASILAAAEAPIVVVATLVALLARDGSSDHGGVL